MKKILFISIAALLLTACSPVNGEPPAHYLERAGAALVEARGDTQQLEEVLTIYEEGLERHPNDPALLNSRAQLLASLGRYEEAKDDLDELQEGELHKEGMLLRCMVHERLEGATAEALACYEEVENAYASEASAPPDANHILAARLAESPEAEALLLEWQASENADPMLGEMLKMEREEMIRQFLP
ncbi:tetratricopeptide repeat protein [Halomonas sp. M4R5S39]|uniref:Tetratricopeptide repeat protein n=1 Tax=Halomonas flagellata TaxID=2920385 RepID=A0ABS9RXP6_9GAMM|nr:tetratricopeptide repeat protein [Halomonas kalidii]MCH4564594.1 tetratricopeptide repeat protein [Halomonas flagellata]MDI5986436.1 tetratricopeptide repeat protein [Halomonas kalidii]